MKRICISVVLSLCMLSSVMAQNRKVYSLHNGAIITNPEFLNLDLYSKEVYNYRYKYCKDPLSVTVGKKRYEIKVANYECYWEEQDTMHLYDVGDFNVIEFIGDDGYGYQYRDDYGILKMNESSMLWAPGYYGASYQHRILSRNGYFVEIPLTPDSKAVIFFGQSYGTDIGRTFIFIVTERDVKLVFNKPYSANRIDIM